VLNADGEFVGRLALVEETGLEHAVSDGRFLGADVGCYFDGDVSEFVTARTTEDAVEFFLDRVEESKGGFDMVLGNDHVVTNREGGQHGQF